MNVTCQDCRSVFRVDPAKVPPNGVRARCSVCGAIVRISVGAMTPLTNAAIPRPLTPLRTPAVASPTPATPPSIRRFTPADNPAVSPNLPYPSRPTPSISTPGILPQISAMQTPQGMQPAPEQPVAAPTPASAAVWSATVEEPEQSAPAPLAPLEFLDESPTDAVVEDVGLDATTEPAAGLPAALPGLMPPPQVDAVSEAAPVGPAGVTTPPPVPSVVLAPSPMPSVTSAPAPMPVTPRPLVPLPPPSPGQLVGMPEPTPAAPMTAVPAAGSAPRRVINPFLRSDPMTRAKRLARALVSDMVAYQPAKRADGLANGTLKQLFRDEIRKSYDEYVEQVGREVAESTAFFQDALNEVLAEGKRVF